MTKDIFSPKERLVRAINKKEVDRAPVICPGGMMNAAIVDVMKKTGNILPSAHHKGDLMSNLAYDVYEHTGFENLGVPFCMTIEAEALGSEVNYGTLKCEPSIQMEKYKSVVNVEYKPKGTIEKNNRVGAVVDSIYSLSRRYPDIPTIGSFTGPLSTAGSLVDPMTFLKELRKDKDNSHRVLDYVSDHLIEYARLMVENGATAICIADPTATGEILGPKMFDEYAVNYLNKIIDGIHKIGAPVIVHICGQMENVKESIGKLHSDVLSVDAFVSLRKLKEAYPNIVTMGNLSTIMLERSNSDVILKATERLINEDVDIISPACGLGTGTPLENIATFTGVIKNQ